MWRNSRRGERYVTVMIDLTPVRDCSGPARLLDVVPGRRGRAGDRLYRARRTLLTGAGLLTDTQTERLENLFADDRHAAVQAAWGVYQPSSKPTAPRTRAYRLPEAGRSRRAGGDPDPGKDPDRKSLRHPGLLRPPLIPLTAPPRQSTDAWSTYAASPWDSAISPATPSAASSTPDASKTT